MDVIDIKLTMDAEYLLCAVYKLYVEKRKGGATKTDAKFMGSSEHLHSSLMSAWSYEDVDETCRELSRANCAQCLFADNVTQELVLSNEAIIYMENRFDGKVVTVLERMAKIKNAIPFL